MDPRDALPRASCCRQMWMLSVIHWPRSSVERRLSHWQLRSTDDGRQFTTLSVHRHRTKLTPRHDYHAPPWHNFLSPEFGTNSRGKYPPARQTHSSSRQQTRSTEFAAVGPWWDRQMDGRTDGRTPYRFIDPASHTMRAVPVVCHEAQGLGLPRG